MKAIDLYAAHALSALISLERGELPMDEDAIAREAHRLAAALAEIMCGNIACSIVDGLARRGAWADR